MKYITNFFVGSMFIFGRMLKILLFPFCLIANFGYKKTLGKNNHEDLIEYNIYSGPDLMLYFWLWVLSITLTVCVIGLLVPSHRKINKTFNNSFAKITLNEKLLYCEPKP